MQKSVNKQISLIETSVDELVKADHPYRKILSLVNFDGLTRSIRILNPKIGRPGYNLVAGFKALILQWLEDLSDRQLERFLQENTAAKLFCGFTLTEKVPDQTYFCELRRKLDTSRIVKLFNKFGNALKSQGLVSEVFTFVDGLEFAHHASIKEHLPGVETYFAKPYNRGSEA